MNILKLIELFDTVKSDIKSYKYSTGDQMHSFTTSDEYLYEVHFVCEGDGIYFLEFSSPTDDDPHGIHGGRQSIEVFATVINITKKFIHETSPKSISFISSLKQQSRLKLYEKLAKKLSAEHNMTKTSVDRDSGREWTLTTKS